MGRFLFSFLIQLVHIQLSSTNLLHLPFHPLEKSHNASFPCTCIVFAFYSYARWNKHSYRRAVNSLSYEVLSTSLDASHHSTRVSPDSLPSFYSHHSLIKAVVDRNFIKLWLFLNVIYWFIGTC